MERYIVNGVTYVVFADHADDAVSGLGEFSDVFGRAAAQNGIAVNVDIMWKPAKAVTFKVPRDVSFDMMTRVLGDFAKAVKAEKAAVSLETPLSGGPIFKEADPKKVQDRVLANAILSING